MSEKTINENKEKEFEDVYGLGGFMLIIQGSLIISLFNMFRRMYDIAQILIGMNATFLEVINGLFATTFGLQVIITPILLVVCLVLLWQRKMAFRTVYVIITVITLVLLIASNELYGTDVLMDTIYYFLGSIIWVSYLFLSKRVENTFRKAGQEKTEYEIYLEEKKNKASEGSQEKPDAVNE